MILIFFLEIPIDVYLNSVLNFIRQLTTCLSNVANDTYAVANIFSEPGNEVQIGINGTNILIRKFKEYSFKEKYNHVNLLFWFLF